VSQFEFDEEAARHLEALYRIGDAQRRRHIVRTALSAARGESILDLGCGPGFYCAELLEEVGPKGTIVGLDSSPQMLALAARRCEGHRNVQFREADATALPVEDGGFDAALCVQVIEYVPEVAAALAELHRAIRPGGRIVIWDVDWATAGWCTSDPRRMERVLRAWDEHLAHPSLPRFLAPAMRAAGFEEVDMQAYSFAAGHFDPDSFGVAIIPAIRRFVVGRGGVSDDEAKAWAAEQRDLGTRGEFFFAGLQFCFKGIRKQ
jgi:arsenite methyltransferase